MAEGISLLDLPQLNVAAVEDGQFVYLVTPEGDPYKVAIEDLVTGVNAEAGAQTVLFHSQTILSAAILTGNATPIPVTITRGVAESIGVISATCGLSFDTAAYATNTVVGLRYVGADVPLATCDILARTTSGAQVFEFEFTVGSAQSQILQTTDLEVYILGGNPITGGGAISVNIVYLKA